jgi:glycosyltransferase involved in cell wall biosynthesis
MAGKVYLGPANTAGVFLDIQKSLRSVGVEADFIPWSSGKHSFYNHIGKQFSLLNGNSKPVLGLNIIFLINRYALKPLYFFHAVLHYDAFVFIKPRTFFLRNIDLYILRLLRKKIVILFVGCNDRNPAFSNAKWWLCNNCLDHKKQSDNNCLNLSKKRQVALRFDRFSDQVVGFPDVTSYIGRTTPILKLPLGDIQVGFSQKNYNDELRILHLPSNPAMKGSGEIIPILNSLKREGVAVIVKSEPWSREKMLDELSKGHILVDSLLEYTFGKMSLEAIQYGCLAVNAYPDWIRNLYPEEVVHPASVESLKLVLEKLIADRQLLTEKIRKQQEFVTKSFSINSIGQYYKDIIFAE